MDEKVDELSNTTEKLKLHDYELQTMHEKYEETSKENINLKEQLDKVGSELSGDMDNIKIEKEKLQVLLTTFSSEVLFNNIPFSF